MFLPPHVVTVPKAKQHITVELFHGAPVEVAVYTTSDALIFSYYCPEMEGKNEIKIQSKSSDFAEAEVTKAVLESGASLRISRQYKAAAYLAFVFCRSIDGLTIETKPFPKPDLTRPVTQAGIMEFNRFCNEFWKEFVDAGGNQDLLLVVAGQFLDQARQIVRLSEPTTNFTNARG